LIIEIKFCSSISLYFIIILNIFVTLKGNAFDEALDHFKIHFKESIEKLKVFKNNNNQKAHHSYQNHIKYLR
jgi:hypothetical protein